MPRSPSGIYTLPPSYLAVAGETIQPEQHNPPLEDIAQAMTDSLPRSGSAPMTGNLQMGGNKITNLAAGTEPGDAVRRDQVAGLVPLGTMAAQNATAVNIDGGTIDGTQIGQSSPQLGTFTQLRVTTNVYPLLRFTDTAGTATTHNIFDIAYDNSTLQFNVINNAGDFVGQAYVANIGNSGAVSHSFRAGGNERLFVGGGGIEVSGTTSSSGGFFVPNGVSDSVLASVFPFSAGANTLGLSSARWGTIFLTNAPNVSSDARLKENIRDLNEAEARAAAKIKPRTFTMSGKRKVGYIAQEIIEAMASEGLDAFEYGLVTDGETYGVDYDAINAFRAI